MKDDLISICIPTYNGEKYLQEALDSVREQTYKNVEVIVSDDSSKDNTLEICNRFKDKVGFSVNIYNHIPSGIGANWNNCILHSKGKYIKFLFQDDVLLPECIETQVKDLHITGLKAVCSGRLIINDKSELIENGKWVKLFGDLQKGLCIDGEIKSFVFTKRYMKKNADYTYNIFGEPDTFLFQRTIFDEVGLFNNKMKQIIDLDFCYRILKKHPILIERGKLMEFRIHKEQASVKNKSLNLSEYLQLSAWVKKQFFWYLSNKEKLRYIKSKIVQKYDCKY